MRSKEDINILFTSAGRRGYLLDYFRDAVDGRGAIYAGNSLPCPAFDHSDGSVITPEIYSDEYIPFLIKFCLKEKINAIVPLFDIDIPVLARSKALFRANGVQVLVPEEEIALVCNDKWATAEVLSRAGLGVPRTYVEVDQALRDMEAGTLEFPLVVKPRWGMGSIGVHVVYSLEGLKSACVLIEDEIAHSYLNLETERAAGGHYIIQEKLGGQEYGLDIICDLSNNYVNTIVKKKNGMRSGETDSAVVIDNCELESLGSRIAQVLPHPGNMDVDVFLTQDGPFILEANARFGGCYPFSHAAGVDVPAAIVSWLAGEEPSQAWFTPEYGASAYKDISIVKAKG